MLAACFFFRVNPHAAFCLQVLSFFFFTLLCDAWVTLWSFMSVLWLVSPIVLQLLIPSGWKKKKKKKASISLHLYDDHHHHTTLLLWLLELETRAHSNVMERSWWRPSKKMWKPRSQVDPVRPASVFRPHGVKSIKLLKLLRHEVFGGQGHLEVIAFFLKCISFPLPGGSICARFWTC